MLVEATLRSFFGLFLFAFPLVFALMLLPSSSSLSESFNSSRNFPQKGPMQNAMLLY